VYGASASKQEPAYGVRQDSLRQDSVRQRQNGLIADHTAQPFQLEKLLFQAQGEPR